MNIEQITGDLGRFRDPATPLHSKTSSFGTEVTIVRDGVEKRYFFDARTGRVEERGFDRKTYASFRSLLASDRFASLQSFRDTQRRILEPKKIDNYLDPVGDILPQSTLQRGKFYADFERISSPSQDENFRCILIDGPAGIGKTSLIERLTLARAKDDTTAPILHVTSRGRRLTNLRDALAGTASDLRAKFVHSEISVLVKYSLIQVALDGFDEFVDPDGYKDAWAALKEFIRECGTSGPLVLAGRDTFFDQQQFESQLSGSGKRVDIVNVRLKEVSPSAAKNWLTSQGWTAEQISDSRTDRYLRPGSYILRPFFLNCIATLKKGWNELQDSNQSPQSFVLSSMIEREAKILSVPLEKEVNSLKLALEQLFETLAEDMADREADSTPLNYLNFVAEVAFDGILEQDKFARLSHSLGSIALLESSEEGNAVRFPHSEVQNRFLIRSMLRSFEKRSTPSFLGRIILGLDRMEAFAERVTEISDESFQICSDRIEFIASTEKHNPRFIENISALALTTPLRQVQTAGVKEFENLYVNDLRILGEYGVARFHALQIARLDLRDGDLSEVDFVGTQVSVLIANPTSRFGRTIPSVGIVQFNDGVQTVSLRSDREKAEWFAKFSSSRESEDIQKHNLLPLVKKFDRICRRFVAQTFVRMSDDDEASFLLRGEEWEKIRDILQKHGRLQVERRITSGRSDNFYSALNPAHLINPVSQQDVEVRNEVIERAISMS